MLDFTAAHLDILVLVGTQTGNGETVADAVMDRLGEVGFTVHLVDMADAYPEMLLDYRQLIAVTCTWSDGTFPDNAVPFFESLVAVEPDLSHLAFGMIGLGDHDYDPFYQAAAYRLRDTLANLGAHEAIGLHEIDGVPRPAVLEAAEAWALTCANAFASASETKED